MWNSLRSFSCKWRYLKNGHSGTHGFAITTGVWLRSHTNNDIIVTISYLDGYYRFIIFLHTMMIKMKQGKSEGFESCDRLIVRKRSIWVKIGDVLSRVTLKFDGWLWKRIGHRPFAVSSFVQHFIAIGEFKLELQSGNAKFGSNSTNFRAV